MKIQYHLAGVLPALLLVACGPAAQKDTQLTVRYSTIGLEKMDTAESVDALCAAEETTLRAHLAELESFDGTTTLSGFYRSFDSMEASRSNMESAASSLSGVHPDEGVRTAGENCEQLMDRIGTDISLSRPLYDGISAMDLSEADAATEFSVEKLLLSFRLAGVDKDDATRALIRELNDQITAVGQEFDRNIREDVRYMALTSAEDLAGLPQDFIDGHAPDEDGLIKISTQYPDYIPLMTYAESNDVRRKMQKIYYNRGYPQNREVLTSLLAARYELAQLVGFDNYAQLITADKMTGSPEQVETFLSQLNEYTADANQQDYDVLLARLRQDTPDAEALNRWQYSYISEKVKQEQYSVDSKEIREYFTYNQSRNGIVNMVQELFQVQIRPWETSTWHDDVEAYELYDGDRLLGRFYLDMHPRDGKYSHAAMFPFVRGVEGQQVPVAGLICNFPPGDEAMQHTQVVTFLHEFGHLIHWMFAGHQDWDNISGISTEWDFVEAPSQMLQEWVWDYDTVSTFAKNSDGDPIPQDLLERMTAARDFGLGMGTRRQLTYGALSMAMYNRNPEGLDFDELYAEKVHTFDNMGVVEDGHMWAAFGHLNGYSAIYYTYQWSLAIATDMFTQFQENGLRNVETAKAYKDKVLGAGGSKPARALVTDFLGRDISFQPYADRLSGASKANPE